MVNFKSMSRKEKIEYIWDYYKLHIFGGLILIFFIGSFIHAQVTSVEYVANLTIVAGITDENKRENAEKSITNLTVKSGEKRKQAFIDVIPIVDPQNPQPELLQKLTVKIATKEIDVIVLDKSIFQSLIKQEAFLRLDSNYGLELTSIKNEKIEAVNNQNNKAIYAVSAEGIKILEDMGVDTKNKVLAIMSNSQHRENAIIIFKWLLGIK
ncbi:hypothetical protein M2651_01505 [Clostridium sp. SYSU_GA19001]|uniref:hypothetical protein n=1 Tax=Clostridium caldaquaticum TaxID=2940653 RepID=UPI00207775C9|nr:hypothetical protein [Clostridium caldaquaticum]MCM8709696.1 hypothetical protein [Clostridium caldaquaticum]